MNQKQLESEIRALLDQFGQVILHGPPGTGKTYAARNVAAALLRDNGDATVDIDNNPRFALVQFHPSYNYEDFVRGVQVKTDDGQVVYETVNRVFGQMAEKAASDSDKAFAMVIDEINRANVSAVLGELIYALEYRGKPVKTPYELGGGRELSVPANLKIIGTMNAADRTIGQIDYAVRRRFAFVHCPPDRSVLKTEVAGEFFDLADGLFVPDYLSPDYDADDVKIGHTYFLADGAELARNVIYQVVPILREYLKDGVLVQAAEAKINEIERRAMGMGKFAGVDESVSTPAELWRWTRGDRPTKMSKPQPYGPMVLSLVRDYAEREGVQTVAELQRAFPHKGEAGPFTTFPHFVEDVSHDKVRDNIKDVEAGIGRPRFFFKEEQLIHLGGETVAVVTNQLGFARGLESHAARFKEHAQQLGYKIYKASKGALQSPHWYVNTGENESWPHRKWENCKQHGFVSGGQDKNPDAPQSTANQLKKIPLGAIAFAYNSGYLGFGVVTREATPIKQFPLPDNGAGTLARALGIDNVRGDFVPENEFAVGVDWLTQEVYGPGVLVRCAYPRTASPIYETVRLYELRREFGIIDKDDDSADN